MLSIRTETDTESSGAEAFDARVDQYALGCIMYEMLTGVVPFLGDRPAQTLTKHVFEPVIPPRKRKPKLDGELKGFPDAKKPAGEKSGSDSKSEDKPDATPRGLRNPFGP